MDKPTLLYDGECSFCIRWVARLKCLTKDRVDYLPSQRANEKFTQITAEEYKRSVQLVDLGGNVFEGAEAVFRVLACVPRITWPLWIYYNIPGFALILEWGYRIISKNRKTFGLVC